MFLNRRLNVNVAAVAVVSITCLSGYILSADANAQSPTQTGSQSLDGGAIYGQRCALCHDNATGRTPTRDMLRNIQPEGIVAALTEGAMRPQATGMSADEMKAVAAFISNKPVGATQAALTQPNACKTSSPLSADAPVHWNGWGREVINTRYQPAPGLSASDVPKLKLKWAYAYAGRFAQGQPTLIGGGIL